MHEFMEELVNAYLKDKAMRELIESVKLEPKDFQTKFWPLVLVCEFSLIDAGRNLIIKVRHTALESLDVAIRPVPRRFLKYTILLKHFLGCLILGGDSWVRKSLSTNQEWSHIQKTIKKLEIVSTFCLLYNLPCQRRMTSC